MPTSSANLWSSGDAYEYYVGRWSRLTAREFLHWLAVPGGKHWLDVGCGTGVLTQTILNNATPASVTGVDQSLAFVEFAHAHVKDSRVRFDVGDAQALPLAPHSVDVVVSGLMLNFVPQPNVALSEMVRVVRPGGVVAVYVWDYAGRMEMMRRFWDAAASLDPAVHGVDEAQRFSMCKPDRLESLLGAAALHRVEVVPIDVPTRFRNFDDYWKPFLGAQGPAPSYAMSLSDDRRDELRECIRESLPIANDGSIDLIARAWAARGTRM